MRAIGILFVSTLALEGQSPAPGFTTTERVGHYVRRTFSLQRMGILAVDSSVGHLMDPGGDWGRTPGGFSTAYANEFGRRVVRNTIELGAGIAFGEDYRFRPSGEANFWRRIRFALTGAVSAYDRQGARRFAWSRVAAQAGGAAIGARWRPCGGGPGYVAEDVAFGYLGQFQNNLLTEFSSDLIRFGRKVRSRVSGALPFHGR